MKNAQHISNFLVVLLMILLSISTLGTVFAISPSISSPFSQRQLTDRYNDLVNVTTRNYLNPSITKDPLMDLTDILSINYFGDGKKIYATFWLASPFIDTDITADIMSYGVLVDADFDNTTGIQGADYSLSINWNNTSNKWYKSFEEFESPNTNLNVGDKRILNLTTNYTGFYALNHRFVNLDIDLDRIPFPNKYRIMFFTQYRDQKFWTVDYTDWITIPLPQLNIFSLSNPVFLPRGEQTTIELRLNATSGYESRIHIYADNKNGDVSVKFIPEDLIIPSYGMATLRLIIRVSDIAESGQQITIPILANLTVPGQSAIKINSTNSNITSSICSSSPTTSSLCLSPATNQGFIQQSSLTIRIMTFDEQLNNFVTRLFNPITTIITTSTTIVSGIIGYTLAKSKSKKDNKG